VKRKLISLSIASVAVVLSLLVLAGCCDLPHATVQTQDTPLDTSQTQDTLSENHHQDTYDRTIAQQSGVHQISSQKAREIAVDFVGYGAAHDVMAFTDGGTLIFEVDVRHDAMRYVVLLSAESGKIKSLNRHEDKSAAVVLPDAAIVPDECVLHTTNETTGAAITQNERAPQTTNETTGAAITQNERTPQTTNETTRPAEQQTTRAATSTQAPAPLQQPAASPSTSERGNQSSGTTISLDRAIEIAYADLANRGINATYRSNSGLDWERGQRVWELLFRTTGERMPLIEYYINAENGNIVKFEWDD